MNTHSKAKTYTMMRPTAINPFPTPSSSRKPTRKLTIAMATSPHTCMAVSARARPASTALRGIGSERSRSNRPKPTSSVTPTAAPIPCQISPVVRIPGMTKPTYPRFPAPPKMYRKISRNITPCTVAVQNSCGILRNLSQPRFAMTATLATRDGDRVATPTLAMTDLLPHVIVGWHEAQAHGRSIRVGCSPLGPGAIRQREEHLVESGRTQGHVFQRDAPLLEWPECPAELFPASIHDHHHPARGLIDLGFAVPDRGERARHLGDVLGSADVDLDHLAPCALLQLGGCALGDGSAVIDDDDLIGQVVGFVQVLGGEQNVGPPVDEPAHRVPQVEAASWIHTRGRLVEQQQPRGADQTRPEVQLTAHAPRVRSHKTVRVLGEAQLLEHRRAVGASRGSVLPEQARDHLEVLASGHRRFDRGELTGEPDRRSHGVCLSNHVVPEDAQRACVRLEERRDAPHEGGLTRAVGAQQ